MDVVDRSDRPDVLSALNPALRVPTLVFDDGRSLGESNAIIWYLADGTPWIPDDPFERAQVLQWQFFEQYDHEPNIAVARFMLMVSGEPERYAAELPARQAGGYRALDAMERHLDGTCVPRRRLPHARGHLAVRLHARGRRGRARHERLPRDRRVARQDRRAAGTRGDYHLRLTLQDVSATLSTHLAGESMTLRDVTRDETTLRRFLHGLPGVDQVGAEARAAGLATRSIKTTSQGVGDRHRDPHGRPDHARGRRHAGQGALAVRQGDAARPERPVASRRSRPSASTPTSSRPPSRRCAAAACRSRASRPRSRPDAHRSTTKLADVRDAVAAGADRDRHGDRPRRVPGRALPAGLRRDRRDARRPAARRTSR